MKNDLVHAHEVMKIINDSEETFTVDSLKAYLEAKFWEGVEFTNCSGTAFSYSEIMEFMEMRGKIEVNEKNEVSFMMSCSH